MESRLEEVHAQLLLRLQLSTTRGATLVCFSPQPGNNWSRAVLVYLTYIEHELTRHAPARRKQNIVSNESLFARLMAGPAPTASRALLACTFLWSFFHQPRVALWTWMGHPHRLSISPVRLESVLCIIINLVTLLRHLLIPLLAPGAASNIHATHGWMRHHLDTVT